MFSRCWLKSPPLLSEHEWTVSKLVYVRVSMKYVSPMLDRSPLVSLGLEKLGTFGINMDMKALLPLGRGWRSFQKPEVVTLRTVLLSTV